MLTAYLLRLLRLLCRRFADGFPNLFVKDAVRIRNRHVAFLASFHNPGTCARVRACVSFGCWLAALGPESWRGCQRGAGRPAGWSADCFRCRCCFLCIEPRLQR